LRGRDTLACKHRFSPKRLAAQAKRESQALSFDVATCTGRPPSTRHWRGAA